MSVSMIRTKSDLAHATILVKARFRDYHSHANYEETPGYEVGKKGNWNLKKLLSIVSWTKDLRATPGKRVVVASMN